MASEGGQVETPVHPLRRGCALFSLALGANFPCNGSAYHSHDVFVQQKNIAESSSNFFENLIISA